MMNDHSFFGDREPSLAPAYEATRTPRAELDTRHAALARALAERGLDAAIITHGPDLCYFAGTTQDALLIARADGAPTLFGRKAFSQSRADSALDDVRPMPRFAELAGELSNARRVGACMDVWSAAWLRRFADALPGARFEDITPDVLGLRAIKSPWELAWIRAAADQVNALFADVPAMMRPGMTERELGIACEARMRTLGHDGRVRVRKPGGFLHLLYVSSGPSAAAPSRFDGPVGSIGTHAHCDGGGHRVIEPGDTVILDAVTSVNAYHADNARIFVVGEPKAETRRAHEFCRDVLRELERRLVPGAALATVYAEVDAYAAGRGEPDGFMGFGENRVRFFGHGVGLELDEYPVITARSDATLVPGMVLAVEPKALSPTHGPAGIENTYLVTDRGPVSLCTAPEEIVSVG